MVRTGERKFHKNKRILGRNMVFYNENKTQYIKLLTNVILYFDNVNLSTFDFQ